MRRKILDYLFFSFLSSRFIISGRTASLKRRLCIVGVLATRLLEWCYIVGRKTAGILEHLFDLTPLLLLLVQSAPFSADSGSLPRARIFHCAHRSRTNANRCGVHSEGRFYLTALADRNLTRLDPRRAVSRNVTHCRFSLAAEGTGGTAKHDTCLDLAVPRENKR